MLSLSKMPFSPYALITLLAFATSTVADPTDWINVNYAASQSQSLSRRASSTKDAQNAITQGARSSAKGGPWAVMNSKGVVPPSGNPRDYLSWAPYHWPDCNWCTSPNGRVHLVHDNSTSGNDSGDDDNYEDEAIPNVDTSSGFPVARRRMSRRRPGSADVVASEPSESVAAVEVPGPQAPLGALPTVVPTPSATTTTATAIAGSSAAPQAAAKTCTPSPTKSMSPSATWTTCPYVVRDGKVNPDVRTLNGPSAINSASQSILFNAISYAIIGASDCSQNAASLIDNFFLATSTGMNPNMNFGQVVRGPGASGQQGTFTGVLDLRGIVKVVNSICILKAVGSSDWTNKRDQAMSNWMGNYSSWLVNSDLGKSTASKANNHATFYCAQLAAVKILIGDTQGAIKTLKTFSEDQFLDQIAASGEQPLEAVRTRPWHYRCFNLEALITLAKLGDQLGIDLWTTQSRYKATIQSALDFIMKLDPKDEDVMEVVPHVAAVAAAYGDPTGKYAAFLRKTMPDYESKPFWFYDQPPALTKAPGAQTKNKRVDTSVASDIPFVCPADTLLPSGEKVVQLDDGLFATCGQLKPLYTGNNVLGDISPV
ncbi:alginate lyase-domain-containing protein [Mycena epipterygia]|nr:alginate lyase-domain-containing protein [Mycena epipterygia]